MDNFISEIPKIELHLHIEGTFEPELIFKIAERNGIKLSFPDIDSLRKAYSFNNLQEFLDIYYEGAGVLLKEQDFYELSMAYFKKIHSQNVLHAEVFFDPQTHTARGISFETMFNGIKRGCKDARSEFGISSVLIMHFLRHLSEEEAFETLEQARPFREFITAVGLDSSELGNPPSKFEKVFAEAGRQGYRLQAHAGEEGPAEYIREALDILNVERIDHGNRCLDNIFLVDELVRRQIALTLCPLSNQKLKVVPDLRNHPLKEMLALGLNVTVSSDDPAYFGGYMNENLQAVQDALHLTKEEHLRLQRNAISASYADEERKRQLFGALERFESAKAVS